MVWMFSGIVCIAQIIFCSIFKDKIKRYLPTLIALAFISITVLRANMGEMLPQRLVDQTIVSLVGIATIMAYHCTMAIWGKVMDRRDPAQRLKK